MNTIPMSLRMILQIALVAWVAAPQAYRVVNLMKTTIGIWVPLGCAAGFMAGVARLPSRDRSW